MITCLITLWVLWASVHLPPQLVYQLRVGLPHLLGQLLTTENITDPSHNALVIHTHTNKYVPHMIVIPYVLISSKIHYMTLGDKVAKQYSMGVPEFSTSINDCVIFA